MTILPLIISIFTFFGLYLILSISFNLEFGYAGQPNFGKVLLYAIGATCAGRLVATIIMLYLGADVPFFSALAADMRLRWGAENPLATVGLFVLALVLAMVVGGLVGYVLSYPTLRLKGDFLAIVMICAGEVFRIFLKTYEPLVGGPFGLSGVPGPFSFVGDPNLKEALYMSLVLLIAFGCYLFAQKLVNSPYGRLLKSVRDDELAANVLGKKVVRVKAEILVIGSAMAALAGALYAFYVRGVFAEDFVPMVTFTAVTMTMLGGLANNRGVLVGCLLLTLFDRFTRASFFNMLGITVAFDISYIRYAVMGLLIILIVMFKPKGLMPEEPVRTPAIEIAKEELSK
ncbi:MAG TPA: branched-chain amino acid ABC transporter permease [Candidatus Bathyarchaeota archaeon]|nr:MAG: branched-chain amino acid ABC transporter permease [Candidatus Bathyarchaeota archaeon]HDJ26583.1 branched-chain amino acid ABC transporter permease [Candidatus Bathyarchaeota archaeon]